ncbi:hypothetical protein NSTC745_01477 [Nostoc sp. DSM 114161]|jgi:hypothetical protein|uniref:hypothetical protein n=1 Tax=Nostoc sp. DSM 114161 TaxID=3440143 RepID=UPI00404627C2
MSEYTLVVRIPQAGNREIKYSIQLSGLDENYPDDYFRHEKNRLAISQAIEQQSARKVSPTNLNSIVATWILDIKSGLHRTVVTLDLPPDVSSPIQTITTPISNNITLHAKQPTRQPLTPTTVVQTAKNPTVESVNTTTSIPNPSSANNSEKPKELPPDVRADTNKADF